MGRGNAHDGKGDWDAALGDHGRAIALRDGLRGTLGGRFPADWATWQGADPGRLRGPARRSPPLTPGRPGPGPPAPRLVRQP